MNMRADEQLIKQALADSLDMARSLVMEGRVYQGEVRIDKPSQTIRPGASLTVREGKRYVSRGAWKLIKALDMFSIRIDGRVCLDVGASTGGFTDVMLRRDAARVYAVDVGYGLLDWKIRNDERVCVMERTNARFLSPEAFNPAPSFGATDVSFISLKAVLPAALSILTCEDARFVALVKPQFEAEAKLVKRGVVTDMQVHADVIGDIIAFTERIGWVSSGLTFSPIQGAKGNVEFLLLIERAASTRARVGDREVQSVVEACHNAFVKSSEGLV